MDGDRLSRYPIAPILTCLPALGYFLLRPQRLMPILAQPTCCLD
jgi:hypothetical protein